MWFGDRMCVGGDLRETSPPPTLRPNCSATLPFTSIEPSVNTQKRKTEMLRMIDLRDPAERTWEDDVVW